MIYLAYYTSDERATSEGNREQQMKKKKIARKKNRRRRKIKRGKNVAAPRSLRRQGMLKRRMKKGTQFKLPFRVHSQDCSHAHSHRTLSSTFDNFRAHNNALVQFFGIFYHSSIRRTRKILWMCVPLEKIIKMMGGVSHHCVVVKANYEPHRNRKCVEYVRFWKWKKKRRRRRKNDQKLFLAGVEWMRVRWSRQFFLVPNFFFPFLSSSIQLPSSSMANVLALGTKFDACKQMLFISCCCVLFWHQSFASVRDRHRHRYEDCRRRNYFFFRFFCFVRSRVAPFYRIMCSVHCTHKFLFAFFSRFLSSCSLFCHSILLAQNLQCIHYTLTTTRINSAHGRRRRRCRLDTGALSLRAHWRLATGRFFFYDRKW